MTQTKTFRCIVDDTALITNVGEIEQWVERRVLTLFIPLHTLERLRMLKKDTSPIGANARKAVKFLDQITSTEDVPYPPVTIQGPEDQYADWSEVEAHLVGNHGTAKNGELEENLNHITLTEGTETSRNTVTQHQLLARHAAETSNPVKETKLNSPASTPPLSASSSEIQSSKTSPEVPLARLNNDESSTVPPPLRALINPVVWFVYTQRDAVPANEMIYLTNSADNAQFAREFGVVPKTIHQLRMAITVEEQEVKNQGKYQKKHGDNPARAKTESEPKTLFRFDEGSSDEEEVVFKPRARGAARSKDPIRGSTPTQGRRRNSHGHSPATSISTPAAMKPQIPTEEIDPDSFDRGSFGRGSTPLANVGSASGSPFTSSPRTNHRGQSTSSGARGHGRGGGQRGGRGKGKLFVP